MTEHDDHTGDDADLLAAEYALGVLEADQRREAEARLQRDPAFAAEVAAWSERLAPMAEATPAVSPPAALWGRIAARLPAEKGANDNTPGLRFWRSLAIGASGLAAASVAAVVVLLARPAVPKPEVATLVTAKGVAAVVVAFDPRTGALLVSPAPGLQAAGHTPHLWLREPGGSVTLVGAIDASKPATHSLPPELARQAAKAAGLALSLEPAGHKPIDRPGGEVVASGDFTEL
jgi:anti-sigma-K factor RskA